MASRTYNLSKAEGMSIDLFSTRETSSPKVVRNKLESLTDFAMEAKSFRVSSTWVFYASDIELESSVLQ